MSSKSIKIKDQIIITTKRLILSEAVEQDHRFFIELLNSPNWIEHIGNRNINTEVDAKNYIQQSLIHSYRTLGFGLYKVVLASANKVIGICGFLKRPHLSDPDIGFAILPEFEGKGYMLEAAQAVLIFGKKRLKFEKTLAITTEKNHRSQTLLEKLGMVYDRPISFPNDQTSYMLYSC
jgi:RimJ/RimL family protein N-acetyltransferase